MNHHLPRPRADNTFQALPPGFDSSMEPRPSYDLSSSKPLQLLYVGGIEPTVYDISPLLRLVAGRDDLYLKICCRSLEWQTHSKTYESYLSDNIEFIHAQSDELTHHYHCSDLFMIVTAHSEYRDFAMPVKLFEAIGYAVPIVSMDKSEVANYVRSADIGWVLEDSDALDGLLTRLSRDRAPLAETHKRLLSHRRHCSWDARVKSAKNNLTAIA